MHPRPIFDKAYTSSNFLANFDELVLARGGDLERLCALANLTVESISKPDISIPLESFIRLLEVTERELDFPDIAFALAERQDISIMGPSWITSPCRTFPRWQSCADTPSRKIWFKRESASPASMMIAPGFGC